MNYYEVSPYGIVGKDFLVLTYVFSSTLPVGSVVEIPVGKRKFVGVVMQPVVRPSFECKEVTRVLADRPLPAALMSLHKWLAEYYTTHPSTVWQTMLPAGLNKSRRVIASAATQSSLDRHVAGAPRDDKRAFGFTSDQSDAITKLLQMKSGTALLHGITGSGKTEVYKALAMEAATRGKSSIILVPEISLTAQLVGEFQRDFEHVIVTHSKQPEAERHAVWTKALNAAEPTIVIGPRSALFMPLANIGLIVIDECHEPSYKQEKAPRYSALRAASKLCEFVIASAATQSSTTKPGSPRSARDDSCRLILGSATPLVTDYFAAQKLNRPIIEMNRLAKKDAIRPTTEIIDMTKRANFGKSQIFTTPLIAEMTRVLDAKKQVLLFHNRRGTASVTLCENCGWSAQCPRCFVPLVLHADKHQLRCHICGHAEKPPTSCPDCHNADIIHRGIGTKRIEEETRRLFPDARIKRFDGDTIKGEGVHDLFNDLRTGEIDVIIGTQTIAKGLDLPNLALVGIAQADAGLMLPDFSSAERTFQLIAQATGRVGRSSDKTRAIIQTYQPAHPAVRFGVAQDYKGFYDYEIIHRKKGHFPPFSHLLKLTCSYKTEKSAISNAKKLASVIVSEAKQPSTPSHSGLVPESNQSNNSFIGFRNKSGMTILGPTPAFYERQRDNYRWQIVVRATSRTNLIKIAANIPLKNWSVELDPNSLI
ncbi:hypothetical protein FACS189431_4450 [Alphaproteobacteria bacterium]|nr:hypothetical protein FACS189431_4450 [Alphaproteobacteria bacterium]